MAISEYIKRLRTKVGHDLLQMPCVAGVLRVDNKILLQRRADNDQWSLPGGAIEPGEEPARALVREFWEETGLRVRPKAVIAVLRRRHIYPNGDEVDVVVTMFSCDRVGGELQCRDGESS